MRIAPLAYGFALLLLAGVAPCAAQPSAGAFVVEFAHSALHSGTDTTLSVADRQRGAEALLDKDFDLPAIAKFVLGPYWQQAKETERQEFITLFRDFMIRTYVQHFAGYDSDSFRVVGQRAEGIGSTVVETAINPSGSGQPIKMEWRVGSNSGAGYKLLDVSVAGVSMALAQREEFVAVLQRNGGGLPTLIHQLKMNASQSK
jgi:phospholipid transport system substrate-binding protein